MTERPPLAQPITAQPETPPSRVMARWMADVDARLAALEARVTALEALHP
jgi:hypothetical protein